MGMNNFINDTNDDDDDQNNVGGGPPMPPSGGFIMPGMGGNTDVEDLLINYNERFKNAEPTLFRDVLVEQVLSVVISKNKPNVLLVGSAGVGKTKIVEDIARRIANNDVLIPDQLKGRTIYELQISTLLAGAGMVGALEEKVNSILEFVADPKNKAILFIDEIHQITGGSSTGSTDPVARKVSQILKPALARGDMSVIGATTSNESRSFDTDPAFARRFTRLIVDELTPSQTLTILHKVRGGLVEHYRHQITVSDDVLEATLKVTQEFSRADAHRPDNAITLLDRAMADRVLEHKRLIATAERKGDQATATVLKSVTQVPLTKTRVLLVAKRLLTGNAEPTPFDAFDLQTVLTSSLTGQDDVLTKISDELARQQLDLFPVKTAKAWMFAGASGVGKTQAAKIISQEMTGAEPIILNMAEYHESHSASKIVGAPPGYVGSDSNAERPFDTLESNPYRVILLDEFEKADKSVQRLFLSAFDEGYIRNSDGKKLDFSRALIICTTNAARESLGKPALGFGSDSKRAPNADLNRALAGFFDTELLGRFSLVVGFNQISRSTYQQIMAQGYEQLRAQIVADKPQYASVLPTQMSTDELQAVVQTSYVESQGARPAMRAIRAHIENTLLMAAGQAAQKDLFVGSADDDELSDVAAVVPATNDSVTAT